jgi:branched-subunit amino acid transport protein
MVLIVGLLTFALRLSFVQLSERLHMPAWLEQGLRFVPAAVLSALIMPAFLYPDDVLALSLGNERLLAGLLAALVAWRTRNVLFTIIAGMGALWLLQFLFS